MYSSWKVWERGEIGCLQVTRNDVSQSETNDEIHKTISQES